MKFKLDENLSPTLAAGFLAAGHDAHSVLEQALGGASDPQVIEVCLRESRALITLDLDFANIKKKLSAGALRRHYGSAAGYSGTRRSIGCVDRCHQVT